MLERLNNIVIRKTIEVVVECRITEREGVIKAYTKIRWTIGDILESLNTPILQDSRIPQASWQTGDKEDMVLLFFKINRVTLAINPRILRQLLGFRACQY